MPYIGREPEHGNYQLLDALTLPDGVFNGSRTVFNLTADSVAIYPTSPTTMIISLGGVLQEPNSSYTVSGNQITFTTPPAANTTFFGVSLGDTLDIGTPSDDSVTVAKLADDAVTSAKIATGAVIADGIAANAVGASELANDAVDTAAIANDAVTYVKMQNLATADRVLGSTSTGVIGEVQIVADMIATDAITTAKIANDQVTGAKLNPSLVEGDIIYADGTDTITRLAKPGTPAGEVLTFATSATVPSWAAAAGGPSQATQSAIKAETNEDTYLPPDLVKHSPGVAKVWCKIHNNGSLFSPDYGISTVGDTGLGDRDVNYTTVFSGVIYAAVGNNLDAGNGHCFLTSHAAADINLQTRDSSSNKQDHAATLVVFGDQ